MSPKFRKFFPWVAYLVFFLASHAELPLLAMASLGVGTAFHWRFWRITIPVGIASFMLGFWWGNGD